MTVTVKFFTLLFDISPNGKVEIDISMAATVGKLMRHLSEQYGPKFTQRVYDEQGNVWPHIQILVNGKNAGELHGFNTCLTDHDEVAIIPLIAMGG